MEVPGGYYADKLDLLRAFSETQAQLGGKLEGVAIYGPSGGLWQYTVLVVLKESDALRINWLVFPHARITGKGTARLDQTAYADLIQAVSNCTAVNEAMPSEALLPMDPDTELRLDWRYKFLLADWSSGRERVWFSVADIWDEQLKPIHDLLDMILKGGTRTYANYGGLTLQEILSEP